MLFSPSDVVLGFTRLGPPGVTSDQDGPGYHEDPAETPNCYVLAYPSYGCLR